MQELLPSAGITVLSLSAWGKREHSANAQVAFCKLPVEQTTEILAYFPAVGPYAGGDTLLPVSFLERPDALRALSQTCVVFRKIFLPILWENLDVCVKDRADKEQFFRHAGETLTRKCTGLLENKELAAMVRYASLSSLQHIV